MVSHYAYPSELLLKSVPEDRAAIRLVMETSGEFNSGSYQSYERVRYDDWCEKHGDMSYNRNVTMSQSTERYPHKFVAADYVSVEVTSSADWDDDHPAGAPLGDIAMFYSASPIKYIRSGYAKTYGWYDPSIPYYFNNYMVNRSVEYKYSSAVGTTPFHAVKKKVSELTPEDLVLLGSGDYRETLAIIKFITLPTAEKSHTITVTLTTDEEQVFSATLAMEFD